MDGIATKWGSGKTKTKTKKQKKNKKKNLYFWVGVVSKNAWN